MKLKSLVIHGGIDGDKHTGSVNVPIHQTSTYSQEEIGKHKGYEYSRTGNPTREAVEKLIADLEMGVRGFAFSSGMAAISSVLMLFKAGDHIIVSDDVYGGTFRVIDKVFKNFGLEYDFIDTTDHQNIEKYIRNNTKAVYLESPTNPLMKVTDIEAVSKITRKNDILLIVDNTFMTPYLQRPLELGADIVLHSATKYLGGHSDLVAGLVAVNSEELGDKIHFVQNSVGSILGPFDSWLLIKGIKTLAIRMDKHSENAEKIIQWMRDQEWIIKIHYPAFAENLSEETKKRQMKRYGGMISFEVESEEHLNKLLSNLEIVTLAESLGGIESLISVPAKMTHASLPPEKREKLGISNTLVRLSVGIEDLEDILADLDIVKK